MPPPQIKQDLNRSGWETTDFPSVCENCLPENPYVQMLKSDYGAECKICTRPFTMFTWKADRTSRTKRTNMCLTCARLKNCCQCCMLDLSFGLPIVVRDAALKLVAPGPQSSVNREYYAQEHEKEIEDGGGGVEEYEKTDEKARELLKRLANSEPYYKKQRRIEDPSAEDTNRTSTAASGGSSSSPYGPGPMRTKDTRGKGAMQPGRKGRSKPYQPTARDILPPEDPTITSLFVTGVEDDLPEHAIRSFFAPFGALRSVVCSHRSHAAFINYQARESAEKAAESCQGRAIISGCPLRIQWGRPRPLDTMDQEERVRLAQEGRETVGNNAKNRSRPDASYHQTEPGYEEKTKEEDYTAVAPPPGADEPKYASMVGT